MTQGVNLKRHCHDCHCNGYWAQGIRPLHRCWRWVGRERSCCRRLL